MSTVAKVVLLDFGFTLADTEGCIIDSIYAACDELGYTVLTRDQISPILRMGGGLRRIVDRVFYQAGTSLSCHNLEEICQCCGRYQRESGYKNIRLYDGVAGVLATFKARGYSVVLVSSMEQEVVDNALVNLGISQDFVLVVGAISSMPVKPDPRIFDRILQGLRAKELVFNPFLCTVVGNSYADVELAKADLRPYGFQYGKQMRYVQANWGNITPNLGCHMYADARVDEVRGLPAILFELFAEVGGYV